MAKRLTAIDKAIQKIDEKIVGLQLAREELSRQQAQERAKAKRAFAGKSTQGGDGSRV